MLRLWRLEHHSVLFFRAEIDQKLVFGFGQFSTLKLHHFVRVISAIFGILACLLLATNISSFFFPVNQLNVNHLEFYRQSVAIILLTLWVGTFARGTLAITLFLGQSVWLLARLRFQGFIIFWRCQVLRGITVFSSLIWNRIYLWFFLFLPLQCFLFVVNFR